MVFLRIWLIGKEIPRETRMNCRLRSVSRHRASSQLDRFASRPARQAFEETDRNPREAVPAIPARRDSSAPPFAPVVQKSLLLALAVTHRPSSMSLMFRLDRQLHAHGFPRRAVFSVSGCPWARVSGTAIPG